MNKTWFFHNFLKTLMHLNWIKFMFSYPKHKKIIQKDLIIVWNKQSKHQMFLAYFTFTPIIKKHENSLIMQKTCLNTGMADC